jgi:hypothetical protein
MIAIASILSSFPTHYFNGACICVKGIILLVFDDAKEVIDCESHALSPTDELGTPRQSIESV